MHDGAHLSMVFLGQTLGGEIVPAGVVPGHDAVPTRTDRQRKREVARQVDRPGIAESPADGEQAPAHADQRAEGRFPSAKRHFRPHVQVFSAQATGSGVGHIRARNASDVRVFERLVERQERTGAQIDTDVREDDEVGVDDVERETLAMGLASTRGRPEDPDPPVAIVVGDGRERAVGTIHHHDDVRPRAEPIERESVLELPSGGILPVDDREYEGHARGGPSLRPRIRGRAQAGDETQQQRIPEGRPHDDGQHGAEHRERDRVSSRCGAHPRSG